MSYSSLFTALIALVTVVGLVLLAGRIARASGLAKGKAGRRLALLETMPLDRTRSLRIVSCDGRELLLLVGGASDVSIGWLSGTDLPK